MLCRRVVRLVVVTLLSGVAAAADAPWLDGAQWIWYSREPMPATIDFPAGVAWFRGGFEVPADATVAGAELVISADNLWLLHVNGKAAAAAAMDPNGWNRPQRLDLTGFLRGGANRVAVEAVNTAAGPAGLLAEIRVRLADGRVMRWLTDPAWKCSDRGQDGWQLAEFDDSGWQAAHAVGDYGMAPWQALAVPAAAAAPSAPTAQQLRRFKQLKAAAIRGRAGGPPAPLVRDPGPNEIWPAALLFVGGDCSLYRPPSHSGNSRDSLSVTIFNPNHGRAYPEHDLPAPVKVGRRLMVLRPARPGVLPQVLWDAGQGAVGPPAVSYDGQWVFFPMVPAGEAFFHLYRMPAGGGTPERLTTGPFHDIDPCELPDGRLVFSSTRAGTFEEYHNPPTRALFTLEADGEILPLSHTLQFDNEPKVLADGRVLILRTDNFFDRGKVETILHAVFPDGRGGVTEFGLDQGPEYGNRLRAFCAGSAAPLPDGRVAWVDGSAVRVARPGEPADLWRRLEVAAADVSALPDGRLAATVPTGSTAPGGWPFRGLALLDPDAAEAAVVMIHESAGEAIHSPVFLGARPVPPQLPNRVDRTVVDQPGQTGVLFCQNVRQTQHHTAGWGHVRAIRVLAGYGLTLRSSHSYLVHAGSEVVELGTVPLAPDGSFAVEVPADTAIALQAVDAEGRSELNQMSWMTLRPGETRGCIGCHQPREAAPPPAGGFARSLTVKPLRLTGRGNPPRFRGNNPAVTGLMELQFDRIREIAGANRADDPLGDLHAADPARQHAAIQHLALTREPAAAQGLAACLTSTDREVRVAAALALAACGNADSLAPLELALADADPLTAQAAAVALENLTDMPVAGFDPFAPVMERRSAAAGWRASGPLPGDPRWLQQRAAALAGGDPDRSRRAAAALAHCGGPAAAAALRAKFLELRTVNPFPAWRADHRHRGDGARFNALSAVNPRTLQEVTRALGAVGGDGVVALLAETAAANLDPETGNLFLAEAAVEALTRVDSASAEAALLELLGKLPPYVSHCRWYGDHDALIACHAAPVHARVLGGLDARECRVAAAQVPALVRMVPTDPDRALLPASDDFETMAGRVIRHSGRGQAVVETCLHALGDPAAEADKDLLAALDDVHAAWAGRPGREIRAAQILSVVASREEDVPRVIDAFRRYRALPNKIARVYDKGIPIVTELPLRHWVCFYLARTLGQICRDQRATPVLAESLSDALAEGAGGRPDPLGPGVHFLHNDLTPCWRAEAAWAMGRTGIAGFESVLQGVLANPDNAPDTRHAAAVALASHPNAWDRKTLAELAAKTPETSIRRVLLETLAREGQISPPPVLIDD